MDDHSSVQQAVRDLALIKRAIERAEGEEQPVQAHRSALNAKLLVHGIALFFALGLAMVELVSDHTLTRSTLILSRVWEQAVLGVVEVGAALVVFVMCLYFIVWRSSLHSKQEFSQYVAKNFRYLRSLSLVADLLVKFIVFSLVILAPRPEWITPLLVVFIADYLIQGRFFHFPVKVSLALGLLCLLIAVFMYFYPVVMLFWALTVFVAVGGLSGLMLMRARREVS